MALKCRPISVKRILLVGRDGCERSQEALARIRGRILALSPRVQIVSEACASSVPDLVVTFGGDGTLLRTASLFTRDAPVFLPISGGTLGFMLPLGLDDAFAVLSRILKESAPVPVMSRARLQVRCNAGASAGAAHSQEFTALNEVNVHRGASPSLARLECSVNGTLMTTAVADGFLVSTPTGSTAYSLSAGGPIVHPSVAGMLITPVCPRSLSFRPALLPEDSRIAVRVSEGSRAPMQVSVDGAEPFALPIASSLSVTSSAHPLPVICHADATRDWVHSINHLLAWNRNFSERHLDHGAPDLKL